MFVKRRWAVMLILAVMFAAGGCGGQAEDEQLAEGTETVDENTEAGNSGDEGIFLETDSSYFTEARQNREQTRAEQLDILMEMLNNENISEEQKEKCAESMMELQRRIEKETAAEDMIKAEGYKEAYVCMDVDTVDVVVEKDALTDMEIAQIEDIVKRETGMEASKIKINALSE